MLIRDYQNSDEQQWLQCRVLAFLHTAYYDDVYNKKAKYDNKSIELVAVKDNLIVGLLDIELLKTKQSTDLAMICHIAVLPNYQKQGIATALLKVAESRLQKINISLVEAWTRDDKFVNDWYVKSGFELTQSYLHVYLEGKECDSIFSSNTAKLYAEKIFAHYVGNNKTEIKQKYKRVHDCNCYQKALKLL